jgi:uncharacterized protein YecE (DUF72 family)
LRNLKRRERHLPNSTRQWTSIQTGGRYDAAVSGIRRDRQSRNSMKFGQVDNPENIDFTIPPDHPDTARALKAQVSKSNELEVYVGCAKWNKADLKNFYPRGTKDELAYYATQFNCIELNATFYRLFPPATFENWHTATPENFRFFPKLEQTISHFRRLNDVKEIVERNVANMSRLREKLEMPFLQLPDNFGPKNFDRVAAFAENWTYDAPLAMEFRHTDWYNDAAISSGLYALLETHGITNILVDAAGRRDLMHMRLTTPTAFVRWVGANVSTSDRSRLDEWVGRISEWKKAGLQKLFFFVHQNSEKESPALAAHFIKKLNEQIGSALPIPKLVKPGGLFD